MFAVSCQQQELVEISLGMSCWSAAEWNGYPFFACAASRDTPYDGGFAYLEEGIALAVRHRSSWRLNVWSSFARFRRVSTDLVHRIQELRELLSVDGGFLVTMVVRDLAQ